MQGSDLRGVGGMKSTENSLESTIAYAFILSSSSFHPSLTGHAVHAFFKLLMIAYIALFSALLSRLTALTCGSK